MFKNKMTKLIFNEYFKNGIEIKKDHSPPFVFVDGGKRSMKFVSQMYTSQQGISDDVIVLGIDFEGDLDFFVAE